MVSITKHIEMKWKLNGIENYFFGSDKKLYNIQTGREIKQTLNCCSKGYWIKGKFYTLNKLRPLISKIEKIKTPF